MILEKPQSLKSRKLLLLLPIILTAAVYLFSTADRAITDYDEGYYAQVAVHMVEHNDWVTPYANGVRFLEKPPLLYWVTAASFKIFGINEFALRLPTALAVIALVWIIMLIARLAGNEETVLVAGLSTAFSVGAYLFTRETLHDIWLVLFLALAMYAFLKWYLDPIHSRRSALLFYAAMAGGFMCKSLIGVAFPLGIAVLFFLVSREWPGWRALHLLPGLLLFLILTVPWHWFAAVQNQGFLEFFFVGEQFLRFLGRREPPVLWSVPLITFWTLILVWFFPWTAFLPSAFWGTRKSGDKKERALVKLALLWSGVILTFFSLSDRLEHYVFPALPALSLLVAVALGKSQKDKLVLWAFRGLAILGVLVLAFGVGAGIWFASGQSIQLEATGLADRLAETDFSIMADMPQEIFSNLLRPAAITIASLGIGFIVALWLETRSRRVHAVLGLAAVMMVVCGMTHWSLNICEDLISSKKFALAIANEAGPGDRLVVVDDFESANSLNFYEPLPVEIYDGSAYALIPGMKFPDAPKVILSQEEFRETWESPGRVFALVPVARIGELNLKGKEIIRVLHRALIRNH
jgi:4-amino-4-deoxy-L-arabinose transferase-like glycosyltransferase